MRNRGLPDRTVHDRHMVLRSFILTLGFSLEQVKEIAGKRSPKFEKTMPEIYEPDELKVRRAKLISDHSKCMASRSLSPVVRSRSNRSWSYFACGSDSAAYVQCDRVSEDHSKNQCGTQKGWNLTRRFRTGALLQSGASDSYERLDQTWRRSQAKSPK